MELPKNEEALKDLGMSQKLQAANLIGENVGKIMENAVKRANKFLKKYGYKVSVSMNFHAIDKDE